MSLAERVPLGATGLSFPGLLGGFVAGDNRDAQTLIEEIALEAPERRVEKWPAISVITRIYARDRFHCRYCGERVILTPVMRRISRIFPEEFPYHSNWKADSTHPAYVSRSATLDHVEPIAAGGDPLDEENLVTACWGCNRRKGDLLLDDIGWKLIHITDSRWAGRSDQFRDLWEAAGTPKLSEDEMAWMRATERANG